MQKYSVYGSLVERREEPDDRAAVYLAIDVEARIAELEAIAEDVRLWLRLDADISRRLELPHGWDAMEIGLHRTALETRDACKERLRTALGKGEDK